jgi:sugar phosphate isomerase/epimerase
VADGTISTLQLLKLEVVVVIRKPHGTELGRGHIDYKPILAAAAKVGDKDYYIEQESPFVAMTAMEAVEVDYSYLRAI